MTNAGGPPSKKFAETTVEDWGSAVNLNLMSTVYFRTRSAAPDAETAMGPVLDHYLGFAVKQPIDGLVLSNSVRSAVSGLVKSLSTNTVLITCW